MFRVTATAPIRPSEDPKKVERAVRTLFPKAELELRPDKIVATASDLKSLRDLIWKQKILDAARRMLLGSLRPGGGSAAFDLNKQAAFAGQLSFAIAEAPLGDIRVEVEGEHLEALFKEIAPPTLRGRPISEEEAQLLLEKERRSRHTKERVVHPAEEAE